MIWYDVWKACSSRLKYSTSSWNLVLFAALLVIFLKTYFVCGIAWPQAPFFLEKTSFLKKTYIFKIQKSVFRTKTILLSSKTMLERTARKLRSFSMRKCVKLIWFWSSYDLFRFYFFFVFLLNYLVLV